VAVDGDEGSNYEGHESDTMQDRDPGITGNGSAEEQEEHKESRSLSRRWVRCQGAPTPYLGRFVNFLQWEMAYGIKA
jgi:hypothetical protein